MPAPELALTHADIHELCLKNDLAYFGQHVLGMEVCGHHEEWSELVARYNKIGINAARDHGKSFFFSFAYVIWRLYYPWIPPLP